MTNLRSRFFGRRRGPQSVTLGTEVVRRRDAMEHPQGRSTSEQPRESPLHVHYRNGRFGYLAACLQPLGKVCFTEDAEAVDCPSCRRWITRRTASFRCGVAGQR
jgi:hypothetical protein